MTRMRVWCIDAPGSLQRETSPPCVEASTSSSGGCAVMTTHELHEFTLVVNLELRVHSERIPQAKSTRARCEELAVQLASFQRLPAEVARATVGS